MRRMAPISIDEAEPVARRAVEQGSAISYEVTRALLAEVQQLRAALQHMHAQSAEKDREVFRLRAALNTAPTEKSCNECVVDEDPLPWCDCRWDEQCPGPCRNRAHAPTRHVEIALDATSTNNAPCHTVDGNCPACAALDVAPTGESGALCGSWPLGWNKGESVSCILSRGHVDDICESRLGGRWRRVTERTPDAAPTGEGGGE